MTDRDPNGAEYRMFLADEQAAERAAAEPGATHPETPCPTCKGPRSWEHDMAAEEDAEPFLWCPACSIGSFPEDEQAPAGAPLVAAAVTLHRPPHLDDETDRAYLLTHVADEYQAVLYPHETGFVVTWTDYVVNDWAEWYASLPVALLRFASLVDAGERDAFFTRQPPAFARVARRFLDDAAT